MKRLKLENLQLLEGSIFWEYFRKVEVNSIDITLSKGIRDYLIIPTLKNHKFMKERGFSQYYYDASIEEVKNNLDGTFTIVTESNKFKVVMNIEQYNEWKRYADGFIVFV